MGAKGKWIRGDVSWNTLSYLNFRRECNEAHVEWMQEFLASHTALANRQHAGTALWLGLNTYAGKNLWSLLAEAQKIGVALVHSRGTRTGSARGPAGRRRAEPRRFGSGGRRGRDRDAQPDLPPAAVGTPAGWRSRRPSRSRASWLIRRRSGPSAAPPTASS